MKQIGFSYSRIQAVARWFLPLCLLALLPLSASAQETIEGGEAFYIWQNDGHFNGFFYDQVQEIRYSRFDTLNVEHNDYVSQEVVTADSTYRIMLTAIDSVSFVQPEIKFAKAVRFMRDEGMMTYYQSMVKTDEAFTLTFSGDMPSALRPKVGDVLSCPDLPDYDEAFVGKVKRVSGSGGAIVVECGYVDKLSDVFEQFITVEQVRQVQTPEGSSTRRRIAGFDAPKRIEGNINDLTLFNFSATLEGNILLREKLRLGLTLNVGFGMTVSAVYKLTWTEIYVKTEMKEQVALGASVSLDGELASTDDLTALPGAGALVKRFSRVPFPAHFPILYVNVTPTPFSRIDAHVKASLNLGVQVKSLTQSFELSETWPYIRIKVGFLPFPILPLSFEPSGTFNLTAEINGLAQTGIKFPFEMGTEDWTKLLAEAKGSVNVYAGPKISGALTFDIGKYLKEHKGAYENLKDTKVDLSLMSIDTEFKVTGSVLKKKAEVKHTQSVAYGTYTLHLFPDITDVTFDVSGNLGDVVTAKFKTSGDVFVPQSIGFGIYTQDQNEEYTVLGRRMYRDETYFLNTFNEVELTMEDIAPGNYMLRPIILTPFGIVPLYKHEQPFTVAPRKMVINPTEVTAEESGGEFVISILNTVDMPLSCSTDESWIHPEIQNRGVSGMVMVVKVDENNTDRYRTGTVTVRLRLSTTDTVEKELTVHQYGGLQISPTTLNFTKDGGEQTVDVLTSQHTITVNLNGAESWLSYLPDGRKIIFTAKKNDGLPRTATVTISSYNPKHDGINAVDLKVSQEGADNVSLEKTEVTLESSGVSQRVTTTNGSFTLSDAVVRKESQDWLMVEKQASGVIVTATPNTTSQPRIGYIDLTFTKTGSDGQKYKVTLTLKVTQKAAAGPSVSPTSLTYEAAGGTQVVTITPQGYARRGYIIPDADKSWLSGEFGDNNTIKFTATANTTGKDRTTTIRCYVTNVQNSTDAQRVYLDDVKVLQKAAQQSALKIKSVVLYVGYRSGTPQSFTVDWNKNEGVIQAVASGGGVHVTCTNNLSYNKSTLSFDIDDVSKLSSKKAIISNLKSEGKEYSTDRTSQWKVATKSKANDSCYDGLNGKTCNWQWEKGEFIEFERQSILKGATEPISSITLSDNSLASVSATLTIILEKE